MKDKRKRHAEEIFLSGKVARRIFAVFLLCAIVPLLTISAVSFFFVGHQLETEAHRRLQQQCKTTALRIYERLLGLETEIKSIVRLYSLHRLQDIDHTPYDPQSREGSGLMSVVLFTADGRTVPILPSDGPPSARSKNRLQPPQDGRTIIDVLGGNERYPRIRMLRAVDPARPDQGFVVCEINPLFLWGIGTEDTLPPGIDMSVVMPGKRILISSIPDHRIDAGFLDAYDRSSVSGQFENQQDGEPYLNRYWSLFLRHRFASPDWTVIMSQARASIMAPVFKFRYIFFLLVLLTLWVILLLSIRAIRKRTVPLKTLEQGALKIAEGQFGYQVDIQSGDEFESLAETFNEMSARVRQSQAMLMQAAKMSTFGQMGAGIVHEIGQPLAAISGFAQLLKVGVSPEKHQRYLETICDQTERLGAIIGKFRSFSRVSEEVFEALDINGVIDRTYDLLDHQLKINRVELEKELAAGLPSIDGDANGLQQVILNLVNNAIHALEEKEKSERRITIRTYLADSRVCIDIADNGSGIPKEIQSSIFDPFFTTKGEEKGTGLGLAIISSIVHKHKGDIRLESTVQEGTCFTVAFPVAQPEP